MKKSYWNYEVQRCWDGELRTTILDNNILCYGKPHSGKTEKVVKPFLQRAIDCGNSIILIANGEDDNYEDILDMACDEGYEVMEEDIIYRDEADNDTIDDVVNDQIEMLLTEKTLLCFRFPQGSRHEDNAVSILIHGVVTDLAERGEDCNSVTLAIDNANWEIHLTDEISYCNGLNFCITTSCELLRVPSVLHNRALALQSWMEKAPQYINTDALKNELSGVMQKKDHGAIVDLLDKKVDVNRYSLRSQLMSREDYNKMLLATLDHYGNAGLDSYIKLTTARNVQSFFYGVQTVICTGLHGMTPVEHKDFLSSFVVPDGVRPPGGKFLVTELTETQQPVAGSVFPKTVMKAGKNAIEDVFPEDFLPGWCVVERNGAVMMFAHHTGMLLPITFYSYGKALDWLQLYLFQNGEDWAEPVEIGNSYTRFLLSSRNEKGEQDEITISYIQKEDVSAYADQATMLAMEVEEYLTHPELLAEVPGLQLKKEAANLSLQKIASHACRNHRRVRKLGDAQLPINEETKQEVVSMAEEYRWRPYQKATVAEAVEEKKTAMEILPKKKILFLGGHANMVKKLRQIFPDWDFLTDDELGSWTGGECEVIFFWSKHCSHLLQQYVNARKSKDTPYLYVTATNIDRLISEMAEKYKAYTSPASA